MVKYYRKRTYRKRRTFRKRPVRKYYRRRAPRRRRSYRRRSRPPTRMPWKLTRTFRYVNLLDANLAVGQALTRHYLLTNPGGPIDPNHAALGWDDAVREYRWWRVKGCKITMKNNNDQSNQVIDSIWNMFITREQQLYDYDDLTTKWENFGVNNRKVLRIGMTEKKGQSRVAYWSSRKWYGPVTLTDQNYWGQGANEPLEEVWLNVQGMPAIEDGDPGMAHLMIQIEFIVEFREPYLDKVRDGIPPAALLKKQGALSENPDVLLGEIEQGGLQEEIQ